LFGFGAALAVAARVRWSSFSHYDHKHTLLIHITFYNDSKWFNRAHIFPENCIIYLFIINYFINHQFLVLIENLHYQFKYGYNIGLSSLNLKLLVTIMSIINVDVRNSNTYVMYFILFIQIYITVQNYKLEILNYNLKL